MTDRTHQRLIEILEGLPEAQTRELLEFAKFLLARHGAQKEIQAMREIPRPAAESVVRAIKRLRETYPMLDPSKLLNETSVLMSQHVLQGRGKVEVIDELEVLFRRHYERFVGEYNRG